MTILTTNQFTDLKQKLIQNRWFIIPVLFGLFYVYVNVAFAHYFLTNDIHWTQNLRPFVMMMPVHIGLFALAMAAYGIGWLIRSRLICGLYFAFMIFGYATGPLYFPYQIIMAVLIILGIMKITKINGQEYR